MKAAVLRDYSLPPAFGDFPEPEPADGGVVVDVAAAGVNHVDLMKATGTFYTGAPPLPSVVGSDGVGRLPDGRRVYFDAAIAPFGSMAQRALVPEHAVIDVADGIDDAVAAAMGNTGLAAWLALTRRAELAAGETVLVLGATGAVGQIAVQAANVLGAGRVVAAAVEPERLGPLRHRGADAVVDLGAESDLAAAFEEAAGGTIDVTIDLVWGPAAVAAIQAASRSARHVQIGHMSGPAATLPAPAIRSAELDLLGFAIFHYPIEVRGEAFRELGERVAAGEIAFDVERVPLEDVGGAWERQARGAGVKLVITP